MDTLLYQLNSDSEGDEGSDIGASEERDAEDSDQEEAEADDRAKEMAQGRESAGVSDQQAEPTTEPHTHSGPDELQPDVTSSSTAGTAAPDIQSDSQTRHTASHKDGQQPSDADAAEAMVAAQGTEQASVSVIAIPVPHPSAKPFADKSMPTSLQAEQAREALFSQQASLATLPYTAEPMSSAEAATLPYDAAPSSTPAADQAVSNSQHCSATGLARTAELSSQHAALEPKGMVLNIFYIFDLCAQWHVLILGLATQADLIRQCIPVLCCTSKSHMLKLRSWTAACNSEKRRAERQVRCSVAFQILQLATGPFWCV